MVQDQDNGGRIANSPDRFPSMSGELSGRYEEKDGGGGGDPKQFASDEETREVFSEGIKLLSADIQRTTQRFGIRGTIARFTLRSSAIAKSHRHPVLFDRIQIVGVERPGQLLALMTPSAVEQLSSLLSRATPRQIAQLSAVESIQRYAPTVEKGPERSVITLFGGMLEDNSELEVHATRLLTRQGAGLRRYGKLEHRYIVEEISNTVDFEGVPGIRWVRPVLRLRAIGKIGPNPIRSAELNRGGTFSLPVPIMGIVDSGIDDSLPWLRSLVVKHESHIPPGYADLDHGTLVGALATTGGAGLNGASILTPRCRLLDIQVIGRAPYDEIDEADLVIQIEAAVRKYGPKGDYADQGLSEPVVVWNLSLSGSDPAPETEFSELSQELDRISRENAVLFVIAAGNYSAFPLRGWTGRTPDPVFGDEDRIAPPADAALGISVGSISETSVAPSAAAADCPSPFSRRGPGPGMLVKPDVVHYGGTCDRSGHIAGNGIQGPGAGGMVTRMIGTSVATPQVSSELIRVVSFLLSPEPELVKLLALLSCETRGVHEIGKRESVNYYGFGLVNESILTLSCSPWECILLLKGELRPGYPRHVDFPFPAALEERGYRRGSIRMVLVYTPVLDPTKGAEYCQTNVAASLGRTFAYPVGHPGRYRGEIPPIPEQQGLGYQYERDLIIHGWKWSPTKVYERMFGRLRRDEKEIGWRLSVDLLLRRELEPLRHLVRQPFWLGIRLVDPEKRAAVYREMSQRLSVMGLANPIKLRPQIRAS